MNVMQRGSLVGAVLAIFVTLSVQNARAQQFELINSFAGCEADGCVPAGDAARPYALRPLVLSPDGNLYGTSVVDWPSGATGPRNYGTIYRAAPDGTRVIVHQFTANGPGECGTGGLTIGGDGAVYGIGAACGDSPATIFRLSGDSFETLYQFPDQVHPIFLVAGSNGALYGSLFAAPPSGLVRVSFKFDGKLTPLNRWAKNLTLAADGNLYFLEGTAFGTPEPSSLWRLTRDDRFERVHDFSTAGLIVAEQDLIAGQDGFLYGTSRDWSVAAPPRLYRMSLTGGITYFPDVPNLLHPLAAAADGSVDVSIDAGDHDAIVRVRRDGTIAPLHTFTGADGSGEFSTLTRGPDGHLYGVRSFGGAHGLGVFYRIRMPSIDARANGADGPLTIASGDPLQISIAFDASATDIVDPSETYLAVVTPASQILWATPGGFSLTPAPLYTGPLPSFPSTPLINIPDASVLPAGDYYWVAIVDADSNGVPNGHYVDFVKTTKAVSTLRTLRR